MGERRLYEFRQFYCVYPHIGEIVSSFLHIQYPYEKLRLPTAILQTTDIEQFEKLRLPTAKFNASVLTPKDIIRDPVSLEFLELQQQDVYTETKLEKAILDHLQHFMLEMGRGFCFEARQKRILIDQDYFKADLIFYHRILKCHIILDLKIDRFRHEYASQLNMYLNYYRHEVMQPDDNPPVGLLLCTDYGETTVRYAIEGLSQNLFVSKYQLQLPSTEEIRHYLLENFDDQTIAEYKELQRQSE